MYYQHQHLRDTKSLHCMDSSDRVQDFTSAVMDVDFSPTGKEFVAGSYDRSVRLFRYNGGHSHEVYTTKRMQRVFATRFTGDATYVVTGSDDFNMRIWKVRLNIAEICAVALHKTDHMCARIGSLAPARCLQCFSAAFVGLV